MCVKVLKQLPVLFFFHYGTQNTKTAANWVKVEELKALERQIGLTTKD